MQILLDADAAPVAVKEILFKATVRTGTQLTLVANTRIKHPQSQMITSVVVPHGPDEADDAIAEMTRPGDLVITADIPLADRVIAHGGVVITPHGQLYNRDNIKERLIMRDLMDNLRGCGIETGGQAVFSSRDKQNFARQLDIFLSKNYTCG